MLTRSWNALLSAPSCSARAKTFGAADLATPSAFQRPPSVGMLLARLAQLVQNASRLTHRRPHHSRAN